MAARAPPSRAAAYTSRGSTPPVNRFQPRVVMDTSTTSTVAPLHLCPPKPSKPLANGVSRAFAAALFAFAPLSSAPVVPPPETRVPALPLDPTRMPSMPNPRRSSAHRSAKKCTAMSTLCCGAFDPSEPSRHACRHASYAKIRARSSPRQAPR